MPPMAKLYPIHLNVRGRRAVVVGAGRVGLRKAAALAEAGAEVVVVAPGASRAPLPPGATAVDEPYRPGHLDGAALAFACTDEAQTNAAVAEEARRRGIWANVADDPAAGDFIVPIRRDAGDVCVTVSTGGASVDLARRLIDAFDLPDGVGAFARRLARLRKEVRHRVPDPARRRAIYAALAADDMRQAFQTQGPQALDDRLGELLDADDAHGRAPGEDGP